MKFTLLLLSLFFLAGCVENICVEQLHLTTNTSLSYEERPDTSLMNKIVDRSVSDQGEVHELKIWTTQTGFYYVQYNPVRAFSSQYYGPYEGDPVEQLRCVG